MPSAPHETAVRPVVRAGRYRLFDTIASGGMASVFLARLEAPGGFARAVAVKRLHPHLAGDPEVAPSFLDEARIASRIRHPNVVPTLDVVAEDGEVFLVMEYVHGSSLSDLLSAARKNRTPMPVDVALSIAVGVAQGLHAAHDAKNERGESLSIVHRDVSPQNILVGSDGLPRVVDFGVAKAASRLVSTRDGSIKGKLSYMSPEQLRRGHVDQRADVYALGVVLWECLTGTRLFTAPDSAGIVTAVLEARVEAPSRINPAVSPELDALVLQALSPDPEQRPRTALELALALENRATFATPRRVAEWAKAVDGANQDKRAKQVARVEALDEGSSPSSLPSSTLKGAARDQFVQAQTEVLSGGASVDRAETSAPERKSRKLAAVVGVLAVVAVILGLSFVRLVRVGGTPETEKTPVDTSTPAPSASLRSEPLETPKATASVAPDTSTSPPIPTQTTRKLQPRKVRAKCSPPYVIENGLKRFKPECI